MGFFSNLFGTGDAASSMVDNIASGIDKIWYTKEEKSEDKAKAKSEGMAVYMEWLKSTSGSRVARRFIAITVTIIWTLQYTAAMLLNVLAPWFDPVTVANMMESAKALAVNGEQGNAAFILVLGYYFLGPKAEELTRVAIDKFKGIKKPKVEKELK